MTQKTMQDSFRHLAFPGLRWYHWIPIIGAVLWTFKGKAEFKSHTWLKYQVTVMIIAEALLFLTILFAVFLQSGGGFYKR